MVIPAAWWPWRSRQQGWEGTSMEIGAKAVQVPYACMQSCEVLCILVYFFFLCSTTQLGWGQFDPNDNDYLFIDQLFFVAALSLLLLLKCICISIWFSRKDGLQRARISEFWEQVLFCRNTTSELNGCRACTKDGWQVLRWVQQKLTDWQ